MDQRKKNRIISISFVVFFAASVVVAIYFSVTLIMSVIQKNNLLSIRDALIAERNYQEEHYDTDDNGYLTVFVNGDYQIIDNDSAIYIYKG